MLLRHGQMTLDAGATRYVSMAKHAAHGTHIQFI